MTTTRPLAETLAAVTPISFTICPVTRDLYGYSQPVLDCGPMAADLTVAIDVFERRASDATNGSGKNP